MEWQDVLRKLQKEHQWDIALDYIDNLVIHMPHDPEVGIATHYFFMNILLEEDINEDLYKKCARLNVYYFNYLFPLLSHNVDYLFCTGYIVSIAPWLFDVTDDYAPYEWEFEALRQSPTHPVYLLAFINTLHTNVPFKRELCGPYFKGIKGDESRSFFKDYFITKGAYGAYMLSIYCNSRDVHFFTRQDNHLKAFADYKSLINREKNYAINTLYTVLISLIKSKDTVEQNTLKNMFRVYHNELFVQYGIYDHECNFYVGMMTEGAQEYLGISYQQWYLYKVRSLIPSEKIPLFHWIAYKDLDLNDRLCYEIAVPYARLMPLGDVFKTILSTYGSLGEHIWQDMIAWCERVLEK